MNHSLRTKLKPSIAQTPRPRVPQQLPMVFESAVLQELTSGERANVVAQLALLLLQAAGMGAGDDDGEL
ncbi:MAG: hypothetical protein NDI70_06720 [Pseudomonas sagittaria]|jgi:hypothetical protein|nr:hypothetical protein [Pseudomonas sagittaria]